MEESTILIIVHLLACQAIGNNSFKSILGLLENCRSLVLIKDGAYFGNTFLRKWLNLTSKSSLQGVIRRGLSSWALSRIRVAIFLPAFRRQQTRACPLQIRTCNYLVIHSRSNITAFHVGLAFANITWYSSVVNGDSSWTRQTFWFPTVHVTHWTKNYQPFPSHHNFVALKII